MPTNLAIDDKLLLEAQRIGKHKTKRETVNAALEEYVKQQKRLEALQLAGTIDYYPDYDPKQGRRKR